LVLRFLALNLCFVQGVGGKRDADETVVQKCARPIFERGDRAAVVAVLVAVVVGVGVTGVGSRLELLAVAQVVAILVAMRLLDLEIGRASCRARVWALVVDVVV